MKHSFKILIIFLLIVLIPLSVAEIFLRYALYTGFDRVFSDPYGDGSERDEAKAFLDSCRDVYITSEDGLRLHAYLYDENKSGKYVITMHGYKDTALYNGIFYRYMACHGYDVLVLDVRGHGESEGVWLSMGKWESMDLLSWIDFIRNMDESAKIALHGISMGGATVMLASGENPEGVVAAVEDCGYSSVYEEFRFQLEKYHIPSSLILRFVDWWCSLRLGFRFSEVVPSESVAKTDIPMLFIHGNADDFVPTWMVVPCYESHRGEKEIWIAEGASHARTMDKYPEEYNRLCYEFIEREMMACQN